MKESPDAMLRRVLADLYPFPNLRHTMNKALDRTSGALLALSAALALAGAGHDLRPDECPEWGVEEEC